MPRCSITATGVFPETREVSSTTIKPCTTAVHNANELRFLRKHETARERLTMAIRSLLGQYTLAIGMSGDAAEQVAMGVTPTALLSMHGKLIRLLHGL